MEKISCSFCTKRKQDVVQTYLLNRLSGKATRLPHEWKKFRVVFVTKESKMSCRPICRKDGLGILLETLIKEKSDLIE